MKRLTVVIALVAAMLLPTLGGRIHFNGFMLAPPSVVAATGYYRSLTADHLQVPSTQTDFPVLVSFTDTTLKTIGNGGHVQNSNGYDIVFTSDSGGVTRLKWEMEFYDATNGIVVAWVKIASLSSASDTMFYMFYGDAAITTDQSDPTNTWDANFVSVWHLGNGTTLSLADSTTGANSLTNTGSTAATAGRIDGAAGPFNGTSQRLQTTNTIALTSTNKVTVSAWVQFTTYGTNFADLFEFATNDWFGQARTFAATPNDSGGVFGVWIEMDGSSRNGGTFARPSAGVRHVVFTYDTTLNAALNVQAYVDGVSQTVTQTRFDGTTSTNFGTFKLSMMCSASGAIFFPGTFLDEVRLSKAVRSSDWITTEFNNQKASSTFVALGAEQ